MAHDHAQALRSAGLKCTRPREAILKHLSAHHGPFSAKEIHEALGCADAVTTYRSLTAFEEAGLVGRCDFGDGIARYELRAHEHHHHHVICTACRKIEVIEDDCHLPHLEELVKKLGYTGVRHVLEFSGVCRQCARKVSP